MEAALSLRDEGNWPPLSTTAEAQHKTDANPPAQDPEHDTISVLFPKIVRPMRRRRKCKFRAPKIERYLRYRSNHSSVVTRVSQEIYPRAP